jgi:hypothetical protein
MEYNNANDALQLTLILYWCDCPTISKIVHEQVI